MVAPLCCRDECTDRATQAGGRGYESRRELVGGVLVVTRGLTNRRDRSFGRWLGIGMCS